MFHLFPCAHKFRLVPLTVRGILLSLNLEFASKIDDESIGFFVESATTTNSSIKGRYQRLLCAPANLISES